MTTKQIVVNGYAFTVEPTIGDSRCYRLMYGQTPVLADTANEDFCGDINTVADIMSAMIEDDCAKPFPWFTLLDAWTEQGGGPVQIENEDTARELADVISNGHSHELTDEEEIKNAKVRLDFYEDDDIKHIYGFDGGTFILEKDY